MIQIVHAAAQRINGRWRFRHGRAGTRQIPSQLVQQARDQRKRCLIYNIIRQRYIPEQCKTRAWMVCLFPALNRGNNDIDIVVVVVKNLYML